MIASLYQVFRHWSDKGSVYIISDTHFDDSDCKYMDENWITSDKHIALINKYVRKNDTFIHLGDVGNPEYIRKINGYKVLIMGNHDQSASRFSEYFDEIYNGPLMISDRILLSHEPIYNLDFCFNIHGHDHDQDNKGDENHINLASNVCGYKPLNLGKFIKNGGLSKIPTIHRLAIDEAVKRKGRLCYIDEPDLTEENISKMMSEYNQYEKRRIGRDIIMDNICKNVSEKNTWTIIVILKKYVDSPVQLDVLLGDDPDYNKLWIENVVNYLESHDFIDVNNGYFVDQKVNIRKPSEIKEVTDGLYKNEWVKDNVKEIKVAKFHFE